MMVIFSVIFRQFRVVVVAFPVQHDLIGMVMMMIVAVMAVSLGVIFRRVLVIDYQTASFAAETKYIAKRLFDAEGEISLALFVALAAAVGCAIQTRVNRVAALSRLLFAVRVAVVVDAATVVIVENVAVG